MKFEYRFTAQLAPAALVGFRGIGKAVAKHDMPVLQRRLNHFCDVLCSRSKHQSHLRHRR